MSFRDYRVDFLYSIRSFCSAEFDAWSSVVRFQQEGRFSFIKYPFMSKKLRGKQSETERTCILDVRSYIFVEVSISFSLGLNSFEHAHIRTNAILLYCYLYEICAISLKVYCRAWTENVGLIGIV